MIGTATHSPPVLAAAPAPASTPADKEAQSGSAAHPFAEMLRQNRLADAPAVNAPAKASATTDTKGRPEAASADDSAETAPPNPRLASRDAAQGKARMAGAAHTPARPTLAAARSATSADKAPIGKDEDTTSTTPSADPSATAPPALAARAQPAPTGDAAMREPVPGAASNIDAIAANSTVRRLDADDDAPPFGAIPRGNDAAAGKASSPDAVATSADAARRADAKTGEVAPRDAAGPPFAEALAESKTTLHATASSPVEDRSHAAAATAALAEPMRNAAPAAQAAVAAETVPVPVDSPEFAAAFGLQVGTLARDGIQRAELHLNPTDMGPVSIQITLDGTQARVDFGADVAATRHAIENGLPELASALRDAGFTLAGGGVSQHGGSNGGQGGDVGADPSAARRNAPEAVTRLDAAAQRAARRIAAGGVDLYA